MRRLLAALAFLPTLAFACPDLTGTYSCPAVVMEGAQVQVTLHIKTEGDKYTITNENGSYSESFVADGVAQSKEATPAGMEGVVIEYKRIVCEDNKLSAYYRTAWYHEGRPAENEVPAIDEVLTQHYYLDDAGNLAEYNDRHRLYLGNERHPQSPFTRTCTKVTK